MQLIADRFVREDDGRTIDLASGKEVMVKVGTMGGAAEHLRWMIRCDTLQGLHHPAIAELADFGRAGESSRFEAWRCGIQPARHPQQTQPVIEKATRLFHSADLTIDPRDQRVHDAQGRLVYLPGDGTGYPGGSPLPGPHHVSIDDAGLKTIARPVINALAEMFDGGETRRPRAVAMWGPVGCGRTRVAMDLARIARTHGYIPVNIRLLADRYRPLLDGRSLFVIALPGEAPVWDEWLRVVTASPRAHVFVMVADEECRGIDSVRLPPVSADALASAVYPPIHELREQRRVRHAAAAARGLPGRFVQLLWRRTAYPLRKSPPVILRAAEHAAVYGGVDRRTGGVGVAEWPVASESTALRRRMDGAIRDLAAGKLASGTRQLREMVGAFARRQQWSDAADGARTLGANLLARGRTLQGQRVLEDAREYATRAERPEMLIDVATLSGEAWIDLARLDEAESVLATTLVAARVQGDRDRMASVSAALARCQYWRGQYAEATATLNAVEPSPGARPRHDLLGARAAAAAGDAGSAMAIVARAFENVRECTDCRVTSRVTYCSALVRMTIGDLDGAERDVADVLTGSPVSDSMLRIRARLLAAEIDRRRGRHRAAAGHVERLRRAALTLPPLVRARWTILKQLLDGKCNPAEVVGRHASASGLVALHVYVGGESHRPTPQPGGSLVDEVVAIVRACQTAEDESVVLKDVCARLRQQMHAAAVWFVASAAGRYAGVAGIGPRMDEEVARRAMTAGIALAPHRRDDRIEAAVPVQYGGSAIAAVCARWPIGGTHDLTCALPLLETTAAAAAPIVSAVVRRQEQRPLPIGRDFIGTTPAMNDLRRTVERAAASPFCVLIEGESGSGKELVARAVHRLSVRRDRAFCTLNCAALPDDLIETELFGHARGAFTGAAVERTGVFEEAHGGTLFLDEVGELSSRAQAKLLRVIQEGELRRVGENVSRRVDVRLVAATNRNLRTEVDAGRFRVDLLYRLDVIRIAVPPLRDRRDDIPLLAEHFWTEAAARVGSRATLSTATVAALARYDWPGNVRELLNVLAALAVRSPKRGVVPPTALPPQFAASADATTPITTLTDARRTFDERFIRAALVRTGGHRGRAAAELGVTRQGLTKLITRLGIAAE